MKFYQNIIAKKWGPWLLSFVLVLAVCPTTIARAELQDIVDTKEETDVLLYRGDLVTLRVYSLTRISVGKQGIVDVVNADVNDILLIGQKEGVTPIYIWDEYGKRVIMARVLMEDLDLTMARLQKLLDAAGIPGITMEKDHYEHKLIVRGKVTREDRKRLQKEIFEPFSDLLIDMVLEEGDLIQIDVQISELSTTLQQALGVDWTSSFTFSETLPTTSGKWRDLFKIGDFSRTTAITATVNALIEEGKGRILSKPSIVVTNAEEAKFQVGGEIPIRTTTTSVGGSSVQENVTFKDYGVDLTVTPEIKDNKIDIELSVVIRDIDAANAVGDDVAYTTRTADTRLLLNDGQTIVLAGFIKHNASETISRVPILGSIPVIGVFFRSKTVPATNQEQEVVISLTPRIIRQKVLEQIYAKTEEGPGEAQAAEIEPDLTYEEMGPEEDLFLEDEPGAAEELPLEESLATEPEAEALEFVDTEDPMSLEEEIFEETIPPADDKTSQAISSYVQAVQQKIAANISFPYEAKEKGWQGTVLLDLNLLSDGSLNDVSVKESSGQKIFDTDAVNTAQILAPYDPFPVEIDLEELMITIPIVYSQEAVLEQDSGE